MTLVAEWFLYANAITGLRGQDLSLGRIVAAGLRMLAVVIILAPALLLVFVTIALLGPVGLLVLVSLVPILLLLGLRLAFWTLLVFDGRGIVAALEASWAISRRALLRIFGWQLALMGLSLTASIVSFIAFAALGVAAGHPRGDLVRSRDGVLGLLADRDRDPVREPAPPVDRGHANGRAVVGSDRGAAGLGPGVIAAVLTARPGRPAAAARLTTSRRCLATPLVCSASSVALASAVRVCSPASRHRW